MTKRNAFLKNTNRRAQLFESGESVRQRPGFSELVRLVLWWDYDVFESLDKFSDLWGIDEPLSFVMVCGELQMKVTFLQPLSFWQDAEQANAGIRCLK